jgi:hypothetical protein
VLEAGAGVGAEQEGGQVDGEQGEDEPEQFHGRSDSGWFQRGWIHTRRTSTVNIRYNPLYYTVVDLSIQFIDTDVGVSRAGAG